MAFPAWSLHLQQKSWESSVIWFLRQNLFIESGRDPYSTDSHGKSGKNKFVSPSGFFLNSFECEMKRDSCFPLVVIYCSSKIKAFRELRRNLRTEKGRDCGLLCIKRWMEVTKDASFNENVPAASQALAVLCMLGNTEQGTEQNLCSYSWSRCSVSSREIVACQMFWFPLFLSSFMLGKKNKLNRFWLLAFSSRRTCVALLSWSMCCILCLQCATGPLRNVCLSNHGSGAVWQERKSGRRPGSPPGALHPPGGRTQQHDALRRPHCVQAPHLPGAALLRVPPPRNEGVHPWVQRLVTGQFGESSSLGLSPLLSFPCFVCSVMWLWVSVVSKRLSHFVKQNLRLKASVEVFRSWKLNLLIDTPEKNSQR